MIPPQCGMLVIGGFPITLPDRITAMIFASVLNSLRKSYPDIGGIDLSGEPGFGTPPSAAPATATPWPRGTGTEPVRAVAVDATVADIQSPTCAPACPRSGMPSRPGLQSAISRSGVPRPGMDGFFGLADSPSPCFDNRGQLADGERSTDRCSAPARPARRRRDPAKPWQAEQANCTNRCVPHRHLRID